MLSDLWAVIPQVGADHLPHSSQKPSEAASLSPTGQAVE